MSRLTYKLAVCAIATSAMSTAVAPSEASAAGCYRIVDVAGSNAYAYSGNVAVARHAATLRLCISYSTSGGYRLRPEGTVCSFQTARLTARAMTFSGGLSSCQLVNPQTVYVSVAGSWKAPASLFSGAQCTGTMPVASTWNVNQINGTVSHVHTVARAGDFARC